MNNQRNLGDLLDEEIANASLSLFINDSDEAYEKNRMLADELIEETLKRLEGKLDALFIFAGLRAFLIKQQIEPFWIENIFSSLKLRISSRENKREFPRDNFLSTLEIIRVGYQRKIFENDLFGLDLAQQLSGINRTLNNNYFDIDGIRKKALLEIRKKIEEEINIQKQEVEIRESLKITDDLIEMEENKDNNNLTLDRAVLLMDYIFQYCNASSIKKDRADVISFLTKYSSETVRQRLSSIYLKNKKNISSYKKDLRIVRNYFHRLGLTKIVNEIDKEL